MTTFVICSVKDRAIDTYLRPFFTPATGAAVRSFRDEVNRSGADNEMFKHPDDYDLYELGHFDDHLGELVRLSSPRLLLRGKDAVNVDTSVPS